MREVLRTRLDSLPVPLVRTGAWLCVILLGVLSWLPSTMLKRTGLAGQIEHLFAYACAAAALTLGYQHSPRWRLMAGLVAYAAVLEVGQLYVPGRHAAVIDWAASSLGAVLGVLAMASLMQPPPSPETSLGHSSRQGPSQGPLAPSRTTAGLGAPSRE